MHVATDFTLVFSDVRASELQLPAVMSVKGVMNRLENGMRVRVDGKTGTVSIL